MAEDLECNIHVIHMLISSIHRYCRLHKWSVLNGCNSLHLCLVTTMMSIFVHSLRSWYKLQSNPSRIPICCMIQCCGTNHYPSRMWTAAAVHISIMMKQHSGDLFLEEVALTLGALICLDGNWDDEPDRPRLMTLYKLGVIKELVQLFFETSETWLVCISPDEGELARFCVATALW